MPNKVRPAAPSAGTRRPIVHPNSAKSKPPARPPQAAWPANTPYEEHPLAAIFPILERDALVALADDIRLHGVREPIVLLGGQVLDGRNRYLAARQAGLPYAAIPTVEFEGPDPLAYVISLNLKRRHLSESQRAMVAAKIETARPGRPGKDANSQVTRPEAASLLNVSERSVASAAVVLERGVPELAAAVEAGKVAVSAAAEVARLLEAVQAPIVDEGAAAVREAAREVRETGHVHRTAFSGDYEWFTPAEHVERARAALGEIDLDPASHPLAQQTVRAARFITKEANGLAQEWWGRVFLNPPYAQPLIAHFVDKLLAELEASRVTEAILLTHNSTDTAWAQHALGACSAICFTRGRIRFVSPKRDVAAPTQGQTFTYFGRDVAAFHREFAEVGCIFPGPM